MINQWDEALEFVSINEPTFLRKAGLVRGEQSYICPCCNNGSGHHGTGITINPKSESKYPQYHCFKCGQNFGVIELYREEFGLYNEDNVTVVKEMMDFYGEEHPDTFLTSRNINTSTKNSEPNQIRTAPPVSPTLLKARAQAELKAARTKTDMEYENQEEYFKKCRKLLDPSYLENRGISKKTQEHFWVGTDLNWVNPAMIYNAQKDGRPTDNLPSSPRCIIPTSKTSYLARDLRGDKVPKNQKKYAKQKYGAVHLFNIAEAKKSKVIFVTEGEIDAMSIYEASQGKYTALGLGSTSNVRMLLESIQNGKFKNAEAFILMLDRDAAGYKAQSELTEGIKDRKNEVIISGLEELGFITCVCAYAFGDDPNEAFMKNPKIFKASIEDAYETAIQLIEQKNRSKKNTAHEDLEP